MINDFRYSIVKSVIYRNHIVGFVLKKGVNNDCTIETVQGAINHHKIFGGLSNAILRKRRTVLKGDIEYFVGKRVSLYDYGMLIDLKQALIDYPCSLDFLIYTQDFDF